jgi:hypothetical protein
LSRLTTQCNAMDAEDHTGPVFYDPMEVDWIGIIEALIMAIFPQEFPYPLQVEIPLQTDLPPPCRLQRSQAEFPPPCPLIRSMADLPSAVGIV